jgi:hypothetical protein
MRRTIPILLSLIVSLACRDYNLERHVAGQAGLVPADKFASYGREQAIAVAIGREFARPYNSGPEAQAEIATTYARNKFGADIVDITPDPLGTSPHRNIQERLAHSDRPDRRRQDRGRNQGPVLTALLQVTTTVPQPRLRAVSRRPRLPSGLRPVFRSAVQLPVSTAGRGP